MIDKKQLKELLKSNSEKPTRNSRVLIVDSMNTFIRNFSTINALNAQGTHIGGMVGFLKSLGYTTRLFRPTRIILAFDGKGSTTFRKNLFPDYKGNRNISRITNWDMFDSKEDEMKAMNSQMGRLVNYLECLPISLVSLDKLEADDCIGQMVRYFEEDKTCNSITILSADKDFLQLVSDKTSVYSPVKRKTYGVKEVLDEYNVHPNNFLIYKVLMGDTSDNIPGVRGLGPKKIVKLFPLNNEVEISMDDVYKTCKDKLESSNMYFKILEIKSQLNINYQLMDIRHPNISDRNIKKIYEIVEEDLNPSNIGGFTLLCEQDHIGHNMPNPYTWIVEIFGTLILK